MEVAEKRYSDSERAKFHGIMGRYFGNLIPEETVAKINIQSQPLLLGSTDAKDIILPSCRFMVNVRRCREAGWHLLQAGMFEEARDELCGPLAVYARLQCGECFSLVQLLSRLATLLPHDQRVDHYLRWIRRDSTLLASFPTSVIASGLAQPYLAATRQDLLQLIQDNYYNYSTFSAKTAARCVTLGVDADFDPLESVLEGHKEAVTSVCFSQDGLLIVSSSVDRTVRLWDSKNGAVINEIVSADVVTSACFNPDASLVAYGSGNNVRVCESLTGVLELELDDHTGTVNSVCFSPLGDLLVSASSDCTVRVVHVESGTWVVSLQHKSAVNTVTFSADGKWISTGSIDGLVSVYPFPYTQAVDRKLELRGHTDAVRCVSFRPDGKHLASSSWDTTIRVWDVTSGTAVRVIYNHTGMNQYLLTRIVGICAFLTIPSIAYRNAVMGHVRQTPYTL